MHLSLRAIGLTAALLTVVACSESSSPRAEAPGGPPALAVTAPPATAAPPPLRPVVAAAALPTRPPYLNTVLPADALGYLRVPSLWGLLAAPKGGLYDRLIGSAAHVAAVEGIREGLGEGVLSDIPEEDRAVFALLVLHARSPIEAAVLAPATPGAPPDLLVTTVLDFPDPGAVNAFLLEASAQLPALGIESPLDAKGDGVLTVAGLPVPVHYASAERRLFLLAGEAKGPEALHRRLSALVPAGESAMRAVESRLESGGQGAFLWIDLPRSLGLLEGLGQEDAAGLLTAFGAGEVRSFAIGAGSSGGIHRVALLLEMPPVGLRLLVPGMRTRVDLAAAGTPGGLVQLGLPGPEDLAALEQNLAAMVTPEDFQGYLAWKAGVQEKLGLGLEDLLGTLGQEVVLLFDEAGSYGALRLRDAGRFDALIARAVERFGVRHESREVVGRTVHHVVLPSLADWLPADAPEEARPCLERRIASLPSHLYFLQEGDYLLFASTPQPLIDRQYVTGRTPVREWLAKHQRLESDGALLLATTRTAGLPALLHDLNLQLLAFLGDLAGRPVDLFAFPTVRELGLPDSGAYGLRVGSTDAELSVELVFEHNPAEVLMAGSGYTGVVVAGVLAAIAVPAYQDYTVRSQVSEAVEATEPLRNFLAEFVLTNGRYPGAGELEQIDLSEIEQPYFSLAVEPGEGRILVTLLLDALEEANAIVLSPRIEEGGVVWECASEMPGKYLPDACR